MQFSIAIVAALASMVSAGPIVARQNSPACLAAVDEVPDCGRGCILDAAAALGHSADNYKEMCADFANVRSEASGCVLSSCGLIDALAVLSAANDACTICSL